MHLPLHFIYFTQAPYAAYLHPAFIFHTDQNINYVFIYVLLTFIENSEQIPLTI